MNQPFAPGDEIGEAAQRLRRLLDGAEARNRELKEDFAAAEQRRNEAEGRATEAEERASETSKRLEILENLRNERYQTVLTELFQQPSRWAAGLTVAVAIISIVVSQVFSSRQTAAIAKQSSRSVEQVAQSLSAQVASSENRMRQEIELSEKRTKDDLGTMIRVLTDPDLRDNGLTDLQANTPVVTYVAQGASRYFRIILSQPGPLRVAVTPTWGDAIVGIAFDKVPRLSGQMSIPSKVVLGSPPSPPVVWSLGGKSPKGSKQTKAGSAGQWFVRVSSSVGSSFRIEASY